MEQHRWLKTQHSEHRSLFQVVYVQRLLEGFQGPNMGTTIEPFMGPDMGLYSGNEVFWALVMRLEKQY